MYTKYRIEDFGISLPDLCFVEWNRRTKTRHTAQFGISYHYSGKTEVAVSWDSAPDLLDIMGKLNDKLGLKLNCCLVNRYLEDKISGIGKHKDGESEHADDMIVSLSFGASVPFILDDQIVPLEDGDICVFDRKLWHSIPYAKRKERVSLTYRQFKE